MSDVCLCTLLLKHRLTRCIYLFQTANISDGLSLTETESAVKAVAVLHALTLGIKIKEKVDMNEKYPVSFPSSTIRVQRNVRSRQWLT